MRDWYAQGSRAWPTVALARDTFDRFVADLDAAQVEFGADLYLACACVQGDPLALAAFEEAYFSEVGRALSRQRAPGVQRDELEQRLRDKLFVAPAKLAQYTGRGPLRMWVRVTVSRMLQNLVVRRPRETALPDALADDLEAAGVDPEVQHMKQTYRAQFREAFVEAVGKLDVVDRTLLHQTFGLRATQAGLAEAYDVHVNTIARWQRRARQRLEDEVRAALSARLRISDGEFDSVLALVRSRLDVSLGPLRPDPS